MAREKKYCINCNNPLTLKAKFCPECGTKVEELTKEEPIEEIVEQHFNIEEPTIEEEIEEEETEQERLIRENKKLKRKNFFSPILSCVLTFALCLCAFAAFYKYYLENLVIETTKREVTVTDTGIIIIRNERTHKMVTKLIARPNQIKRYGIERKDVIEIAREHQTLGYNMI